MAQRPQLPRLGQTQPRELLLPAVERLLADPSRRRTSALIGTLDLNDDIGWQEYRGLKLSMQRRAARGLSLNGNYTWSRCMGTKTPNT